MTEWREVTLGDVADLLVGFAFKSARFTDGENGLRLLRGVNIGQGSLDWSRCARWPENERSEYKRYELIDGDVVLAMDRPWIEAGLKRARVRSSDLPALLVQRVTRMRGTELVRTSFLHHVVGSRRFSDYIKPIVTGVNVPHISPDQIRAFSFRLPALLTQDTICSVLDAIDGLIENNRRRIALLERIAQAIYREWFVHFRYPGHEDDKLVDSPLGPIPAGWRVVPLSDVASLERRNVRPAESRGVAFEHFSIPNFDAGRLAAWEPGESIKSGKYAVAERSVLVSKLNPRITRVWLANPATRNRSVASTEFLVLRPRSWSLEILYLMACSTPFQEQVVSLAGGTSTSHQRAKPTDFMALSTIDPPLDLARRASEIVQPMVSEIVTLRRHETQATSLRDLLLPRLVTGVIDVSELDLDALLEEPA